MASSGLGDAPLRSKWVTRVTLRRDLHYANADTALRTMTVDFFFGTAVVSPLKIKDIITSDGVFPVKR